MLFRRLKPFRFSHSNNVNIFEEFQEMCMHHMQYISGLIYTHMQYTCSIYRHKHHMQCFKVNHSTLNQEEIYKQAMSFIANHTYLPIHKRVLHQMMNCNSHITLPVTLTTFLLCDNILNNFQCNGLTNIWYYRIFFLSIQSEPCAATPFSCL